MDNKNKKRYKRQFTSKLIAALFIFMVSTLVTKTVSASLDVNPTITISPNPATIRGCETIALDIYINNAVNIYGVDAQLTFDPNVIEVVDADPSQAGIQIQIKSSFMSIDYVVKNVVDNTRGTIWFAFTQLNPSPPVSGSGSVATVHFRARSSGTSNIIFSDSTTLGDRNGGLISVTAINGAVNTIALQAPVISITRLDASDARLSWSAVTGANGYRLYRGVAPYFTPADPPYQQLTGLSYDDVGALGDVSNNHYYVIKSTCSTGLVSAISNRVGEYDYPLRAKWAINYNDIALVLNVEGVKNASSLANYIGSSVKRVLRYNASTQSFQSYDVGDPDTDFNLSIGQFLFVVTDSTAPASFALVGGVPAAGSVSFSLISGSPPKYNFLSLPLDRSNPTLASQVAASVGGSVYGVIRYQISTQSYQRYDPGDPDTDFPLVIGEPFGLILNPGAPANWP